MLSRSLLYRRDHLSGGSGGTLVILEAAEC